MNSRRNSIITAIIAMIIFILFDQITKYWAGANLQDGPLVIWDGVFELRYIINTGSAFGMLKDQRIFFLIITPIVTLIIGYFYLRTPLGKRYRPLRYISVIILAGAFGNMIDRLVYGHVRDFLYFSLIDFPIFNVADCYVVISVICLFIFITFYYKEEELVCLFPSRKKKVQE